MTLRTLAMVAALWLACAASALAQGNGGNGTGTGNEQPGTSENNGGNTGGNSQVEPGGGTGTGGDAPGEDYYDGADLAIACENGSATGDNTFTLTKNIVTSSTINVNFSITIDLNGHSITSSNDHCFYINENATMAVVDRSTGSQKGSIICSDKGALNAIEINSGGKLIADGVNISCPYGWAICNDVGTAEISGCTVSGKIGIYNYGTMTVTGGSISGTDTAIDNISGIIFVNPDENPAACSISGGNWGIYNRTDSKVTIGSGVSLANYSVSGIFTKGVSVTLNAWPTFSAANSAGVNDIWLFPNQKITIGCAITAAPAKKISVRATDINTNDLTADALPVTFTSGYAEKVKDGSGNVIDPAEVFTYYKSDAGFAVALGGDNNSEAILTVDPANAPVGYDLTSILSPTASGDFNIDWEFEMPDYDVLVYFVYEDLFDPVTFAFAEGQEWMTWCHEASFYKPNGIDAYTIADATPEAITVTQITASDASQPAVLPAYTPLLLRKNGDNGLTAKQYAVPTAPTDDLFKDYGIASHATTGCTVFGSTKAVTDAARSQVFALGRTYMLKGGEFVAMDQFDGIAANRCWLTLSGTPAASRLLIRTGDATDIRTVAPGPAPSDDHWYSLTGIRVKKPTRGVYIHNGRKEVIK